MPSCSISTHIVQIAYKKWIEMHDFVPFFSKKNAGEDPRPPPPFHINLWYEGVI